MSAHTLKCWRGPFEAMRNGEKTFEYRRNDRGYAVDDVLHLKEWDESGETFTGRDMLFLVTYVLAFPNFGVPEGYVVMSLRRLTVGSPPARGEG